MSLPGMDVLDEQQAEEDEDRPVFTKSKASRAARAARPASMTSASPTLVQDVVPLQSLSHEYTDTMLCPNGQVKQSAKSLDVHQETFSEPKQLVYNTQ